MAPVLRRSAPAEREDAVDDARAARRRAVAQRGEIGNEPEVPEEERDGEVRRHRGRVPRERAAELRPHAHRRRVGNEPVSEPRPPEVEEREHPRLDDGEERHRLGEAVDARAPLLLEQEQDRRDERAGVTDADPPDEVDDREAPTRPGCCCPRRRCRCRTVADHRDEHDRGAGSAAIANAIHQRERRRPPHRRRELIARAAASLGRAERVDSRGPSASRRAPGSGCRCARGTSCAGACRARAAPRSCAARARRCAPRAPGRRASRTDRPRRARLLARGADLAVARSARLAMRASISARADALHAVRALLHHAALRAR